MPPTVWAGLPWSAENQWNKRLTPGSRRKRCRQPACSLDPQRQLLPGLRPAGRHPGPQALLAGPVARCAKPLTSFSPHTDLIDCLPGEPVLRLTAPQNIPRRCQRTPGEPDRPSGEPLQWTDDSGPGEADGARIVWNLEEDKYVLGGVFRMRLRWSLSQAGPGGRGLRNPWSSLS